MNEKEIFSQWDKVLLKLVKRFYCEIFKLDHHEFVKFCLEKDKRSEVEEFLTNIKKSNLKDSAVALQKKEEGNKKFKKKQYEESVLLYTESIFHAAKDDDVLPLSYSNRSLALEHLGCYSESITDIDLALEYGYPEERVPNLFVRKARCLMQLKDGEKAKEILTEALKHNKKKEYIKIIETELKKARNLKTSTLSQQPENKLPELFGGENENFPFASKYLSVGYDEKRGRYVIANESIPRGEVLFVEKSYAHVTWCKVCCTCCKNSKAPVPCWNCTASYYCSPKCRDDAWNSFHSFECGFNELINSIGIGHLSLRIVLTASSSLDELKKILSNISEPAYKTDSVIKISKGYEAVYNLVHHSQRFNKKDIFQYALTASLIALFLKNYTSYFPPESDEEDLSLLCSVLLRHILQLIINGFGISHSSEGSLRSAICERISHSTVASAVYTSASLMNHSCKPSVTGSFYQNYKVVRAQKEIRKGEEVFNSYGPDSREMKRSKRQEILSQQYFFQCTCTECLSRFDNYDILTAFKCNRCNGPLVPMEENSRNAYCIRGYHQITISQETEEKRNIFYSLMAEASEVFGYDIKSSLSKYLQAWRIGREIFCSTNVDLALAASEVAHCLVELRDFRRSILFLKCLVRSVENRYGLLSIQTASELKKLADIIAVYLLHNENAGDSKDLRLEAATCYAKIEMMLELFPESKLREKRPLKI